MADCKATPEPLVAGLNDDAYCWAPKDHSGAHRFRSSRDGLWRQVTDDAARRLDATRGLQLFEKFTCQACGARQTMSEPNRFYTSGGCEECGATTDITANGCNFMALMKEVESSEAVDGSTRFTTRRGRPN